MFLKTPELGRGCSHWRSKVRSTVAVRSSGNAAISIMLEVNMSLDLELELIKLDLMIFEDLYSKILNPLTVELADDSKNDYGFRSGFCICYRSIKPVVFRHGLGRK